ncbi:fibronectin type III domain-containing protein [Leadbettera azotonutricia]|nr:fibronectin type III domain-containing protein [Leadbettera azotonutricia]
MPVKPDSSIYDIALYQRAKDSSESWVLVDPQPPADTNGAIEVGYQIDLVDAGDNLEYKADVNAFLKLGNQKGDQWAEGSTGETPFYKDVGTVSIILSPIALSAPDAKGIFSWDLSLPSGVSIKSLELSGETLVNLGSLAASGTKTEVPAGIYDLALVLEKTGEAYYYVATSLYALVYIYPGMESKADNASLQLGNLVWPAKDITDIDISLSAYAGSGTTTEYLEIITGSDVELLPEDITLRAFDTGITKTTFASEDLHNMGGGKYLLNIGAFTQGGPVKVRISKPGYNIHIDNPDSVVEVYKNTTDKIIGAAALFDFLPPVAGLIPFKDPDKPGTKPPVPASESYTSTDATQWPWDPSSAFASGEYSVTVTLNAASGYLFAEDMDIDTDSGGDVRNIAVNGPRTVVTFVVHFNETAKVQGSEIEITYKDAQGSPLSGINKLQIGQVLDASAEVVYESLKVDPDNNTPIWGSSDESVAIINRDTGVIRAMGAGTTYISYVTAGGMFSNRTLLTVAVASQTVPPAYSPTSLADFAGETLSLNQVRLNQINSLASGVPGGNGTIKYSIASGGDFASINENTGVLTMVGTGVVTVKVTISDAVGFVWYSGVSASIPLTAWPVTPVSGFTVLSSSLKAHLSWTRPAGPDAAYLTGYEITYTPNAPGSPIELGPNLTAHTITNLTNGVDYTFSIRAKYKSKTDRIIPPSEAKTAAARSVSIFTNKKMYWIGDSYSANSVDYNVGLSYPEMIASSLQVTDAESGWKNQYSKAKIGAFMSSSNFLGAQVQEELEWIDTTEVDYLRDSAGRIYSQLGNPSRLYYEADDGTIKVNGSWSTGTYYADTNGIKYFVKTDPESDNTYYSTDSTNGPIGIIKVDSAGIVESYIDGASIVYTKKTDSDNNYYSTVEGVSSPNGAIRLNNTGLTEYYRWTSGTTDYTKQTDSDTKYYSTGEGSASAAGTIQIDTTGFTAEYYSIGSSGTTYYQKMTDDDDTYYSDSTNGSIVSTGNLIFYPDAQSGWTKVNNQLWAYTSSNGTKRWYEYSYPTTAARTYYYQINATSGATVTASTTSYKIAGMTLRYYAKGTYSSKYYPANYPSGNTYYLGGNGTVKVSNMTLHHYSDGGTNYYGPYTYPTSSTYYEAGDGTIKVNGITSVYMFNGTRYYPYTYPVTNRYYQAANGVILVNTSNLTSGAYYTMSGSPNKYFYQKTDTDTTYYIANYGTNDEKIVMTADGLTIVYKKNPISTGNIVWQDATNVGWDVDTNLLTLDDPSTPEVIEADDGRLFHSISQARAIMDRTSDSSFEGNIVIQLGANDYVYYRNYNSDTFKDLPIVPIRENYLSDAAYDAAKAAFDDAIANHLYAYPQLLMPVDGYVDSVNFTSVNAGTHDFNAILTELKTWLVNNSGALNIPDNIGVSGSVASPSMASPYISPWRNPDEQPGVDNEGDVRESFWTGSASSLLGIILNLHNRFPNAGIVVLGMYFNDSVGTTLDNAYYNNLSEGEKANHPNPATHSLVYSASQYDRAYKEMVKLAKQNFGIEKVTFRRISSVLCGEYGFALSDLDSANTYHPSENANRNKIYPAVEKVLNQIESWDLIEDAVEF